MEDVSRNISVVVYAFIFVLLPLMSGIIAFLCGVSQVKAMLDATTNEEAWSRRLWAALFLLTGIATFGVGIVLPLRAFLAALR